MALPAALKVKSFPLRAHATFVWIWMGDPAKPDAVALPQFPWFADSVYLRRCKHYEIGCNYMRKHENILDLTHGPALHADVAGPVSLGFRRIGKGKRGALDR